ncbi:short-chain dehydrogenase [Actinomycetes bacterium]|nr:short-chain dehydrogenase [Actinomycetes bacterium]
MTENVTPVPAGQQKIHLTDRVAIVTGAGAGLGRSYAIALASRGAKVLVNDLGSALDGAGKDTSPADLVVAEILANGGQAVANYTSVASADGGEEIVNHAISEFGGVDIVVNNAGNMRLSSFAKLDVRTISDVLDVHLGGAFYVTKPAYLFMMEQKRGRIIFTTSGLGVFGIYGADVYAAAKGGIGGLLTVLALEGERHGIRVNGVAPMARTRMSGDDLYSALPAEYVGAEHAAPVVEYFASDECAVTGEVWSVGAGSVSRLFSARTKGYFKHPGTHGQVTAEDLAAHLPQIRDVTAFTQPANWLAEWEEVVQMHQGT